MADTIKYPGFWDRLNGKKPKKNKPDKDSKPYKPKMEYKGGW